MVLSLRFDKKVCGVRETSVVSLDPAEDNIINGRELKSQGEAAKMGGRDGDRAQDGAGHH